MHSRRIDSELLLPLLLTLLALAAILLLAPAGSAGREAGGGTVRFSLPGGYYAEDIRLTLRGAGPGEKIVYTLDGGLPTAGSPRYTTPLFFPETEPTVIPLRARLLRADGSLGPVRTATYALNLPASLPILSLVTDPPHLWDGESGIYANPLQKGPVWERPVAVTYIDENRRDGFEIAAGLRLHGGYTRTYDKKSFRLYFRNSYGASWLEYPLFSHGSEEEAGRARFKRLVVHNGGQDGPRPYRNWSLLRNQLTGRLAAEMGGIYTRSRPVLLYLNGELWGVYQLRERIDERFLATRYDVPAAELLEAPELDENRTVAGAPRAHWDRLQAYLRAHDLSDPVAYATVTAQIDVANFIDYTLLQIYTANIDWPHRNVIQFRPAFPGGEWQWIFWDSDYSFGLDPFSYVDYDMVAQALDPAHPDTGGGDTLLLRKLLENEHFRHRFLRRADELLNTTLAPASVDTHLEALSAELRPDIWYEAGRWQSMVRWEDTIAGLYRFIDERPAVMRAHLMQALALRGTASVGIGPPAGGKGRVSVNGRLLPSLPYRGTHFLDVPLTVTAIPAAGYRFAGWEERAGPATLTVVPDGELTLTPRFEQLPADAPRPGDVVILDAGRDTAPAPGATPIAGDWIRLQVRKVPAIDLRGWRVTDNDGLDATGADVLQEGSLLLPDDPVLARVPWGSDILLVATPNLANDERFPTDDLAARDGTLLFYRGNGRLNVGVDSWFSLAKNDSIVLLAPGPTAAYADDRVIDFMTLAPGAAATDVSPLDFGLLPDN